MSLVTLLVIGEGNGFESVWCNLLCFSCVKSILEWGEPYSKFSFGEVYRMLSYALVCSAYVS